MEVPKVHVQEVVKHVPKHVVETREHIVEIPCIQVAQKTTYMGMLLQFHQL